MEETRTAPQALEAEQSVLGAMLIEPETAVPQMVERLNASDFYRAAHQHIFRVMADLSEEGVSIDPITVTTKLRNRGVLDEVGGASYLHQLTDFVPSAAAACDHAKEVAEKARCRSLIETCKSATNQLYGGTSTDAAATLQAAILEAGIRNTQRELVPLAEIYTKGLDELTRRRDRFQKNPHSLTGFTLTIPKLDKATDGMQRGTLTILSAPTACGKSSLALQLGLKNVERGAGVLFFSLEMSEQQMFERIVAHHAGLSILRLRRGDLTTADWDRLDVLSDKVQRPFTLCDTPDLTVYQIGAMAQTFAAQQPLGLVVVDYLQIVTSDRLKGQTREQEVAAIAVGLKALAKRLDVAVLALSQLNEANQPRESRAISHTCDLALRIDQVADPISEDPVPVKIIIDKARQGPTGLAIVKWDRPVCRFHEEDTRHSEPAQEDDEQKGDPPDEQLGLARQGEVELE